MSVPKVRLYVRVVLPDGKRPFLDPVPSGNHKLKEGWAIYNDQPQRFDDAVYYLRYAKSGKRVWERIGSDAQQALVARKQLETRLVAVAQGIALAPVDGHATEDDAKTSRVLLDCIADYLTETKNHKAKRTHSNYRKTLHTFLQSLDSKRKDTPIWVVKGEPTPEMDDFLRNPDLLSRPVQTATVEGITRADMLAYMKYLEGRGNKPRTIANRVEYLQIFLHHFGLPSILKGKDKPQYTDKVVRAYKPTELERMFREATVDEADLLHFFLCTGTREQEVQFACWPDVDLEAKHHRIW